MYLPYCLIMPLHTRWFAGPRVFIQPYPSICAYRRTVLTRSYIPLMAEVLIGNGRMVADA